jgi:preprotein translocase SecE subunit
VSEAVDTLQKKEGSESVGPGQFIKQTREELNKVSFPSSDDVKGTTLIVVLNVIFFAIFLYLVDQGWVYVLKAIEWIVNTIAGL